MVREYYNRPVVEDNSIMNEQFKKNINDFLSKITTNKKLENTCFKTFFINDGRLAGEEKVLLKNILVYAKETNVAQIKVPERKIILWTSSDFKSLQIS